LDCKGRVRHCESRFAGSEDANKMAEGGGGDGGGCQACIRGAGPGAGGCPRTRGPILGRFSSACRCPARVLFPPTATQVMARLSGRPTPLSAISDALCAAVIAAEDRRFLGHAGVDPVGIGRAVLTLGRSGGGSTITQQARRALAIRHSLHHLTLPSLREATANTLSSLLSHHRLFICQATPMPTPCALSTMPCRAMLCYPLMHACLCTSGLPLIRWSRTL
jgi:hypothetical protein